MRPQRLTLVSVMRPARNRFYRFWQQSSVLWRPGPVRRRVCLAMGSCFYVDVEASAPAGPWRFAAAAALDEFGACVLTPSQESTLIAPSVVKRCCDDARPRLDHLHDIAMQYRQSGGVMGKTVPGALQFRELVSRHPRECRFDVTCFNERLQISDSSAGANQWVELLAAVDALVQPILLMQSDHAGSTYHAEAVGFVLSQPGAPVQQWHPDDACAAARTQTQHTSSRLAPASLRPRCPLHSML